MLEKSVADANVVISKIKPKKVKRPLSYTSAHRAQLRTVLEKLDGRFVGVDFIKQDGSVRKLNGRLGVHSYCNGGESTVEKDSRPYVTVFDVKAMEYRVVNLATTCSLRADRQVYSIVG